MHQCLKRNSGRMISRLLHFVLLSYVVISEGKNPQRHPIMPGRLIINIDFAQLCDGVTQLVRTNLIRVEKLGDHSVVVNADVYLNRSVNLIKQTIITFENCLDATHASCQTFQTWRLKKETCTMMVTKNVFWSPVFGRFHPELRCPIKAGPYKLINGTLDVAALERMPVPLERYHWRVTLKAFDEDVVACVHAGARFVRSRT